MEPDDSIHFGGQPFVMGRDQGRAALLPHQPDKFCKHQIGGRFVQIAGRLIGENLCKSDSALSSASFWLTPEISCGMTTFSSAEKSGSRWWN